MDPKTLSVNPEKIKATTQWLLDGPAWIRYNTLINLLGEDENSPEVRESYQATLADSQISALVKDVQSWDDALLKRHNDANHPIHKLSFLTEIGLCKDAPGIQTALESITGHESPEGPLQVLSNYPTHFGGSGKNEWLWVLCDAPLIFFSLVRLDKKYAQVYAKGIQHLTQLSRENGWPCAAADAIGKFKGPGKRSDPCPYANLLMLKLHAELGTPGNEEPVKNGVETLLSLWEHSRNERPFLFKMGTNFRKLKVPFVWYDILHVAHVLSQFPGAHADERFQSMLSVILSKADSEFRFQSESIWTKWKGWEFCQKREPSYWVTYCVLKILKQSGYPIT